jgi:hypothetical protein
LVADGKCHFTPQHHPALPENGLKLDPNHAKARARLNRLVEIGAIPAETSSARWRIAARNFGGCIGSVLLGMFLGICMSIVFNILFDALFGLSFFLYMISDGSHTGFCSAALAIFIMCFMLRYVDGRLKRSSTIMMIAVATTALLPWVLFACFIIMLVLTGTEM